VGRSRERGQATVEFALVLPILVLALMAVLQVALVVRDHVAVVNAAREAARQASVDSDPSAAQWAARRSLPHSHAEVGPRPSIGEPITVRVTYRSHTDLPLVGALFPDPLLESEIEMRVEK
jgi:Flp pilus assembly protein TadG